MIRVTYCENGSVRRWSRHHEELTVALTDLVHTVGVEQVVVHHEGGALTVYEREPEQDAPTLDLTPDELLREHGVVTVPLDTEDPAGALERFRVAVDEFAAVREAREAGRPPPATPVLDGYVREQAQTCRSCGGELSDLATFTDYVRSEGGVCGRCRAGSESPRDLGRRS